MFSQGWRVTIPLLGLLSISGCSGSSASDPRPFTGALPSGTMLFSTGLLSEVFEMDLPTRKIQHLDIKAIRNGHADFVGGISGPYHGKFILAMTNDPNLLIELLPGGHCKVLKELHEGTSLSPDGRSVAYLHGPLSDDSDPYELMVYDLATGKTRILASHVVGRGLTWSPDSKSVIAIIEMPPKKVPWGDSDDHVHDVAQWVATNVPIDGKPLQPLGIGNNAVWIDNNQVVMGGEYRFYRKLSDPSPFKTTKFAGVLSIPTPGFMISDHEPTGFDSGVPKFGSESHSLFETAGSHAIRYGTVDGSSAVSLVRVAGAGWGNDIGDAFSMSFSPERY